MRGTLLALILSTAPILAMAAGLVPCGGANEEACQACHLLQMAQGIINWFIAIMATVCAVAVAIAGFKMLTSGGNPGKISEAKGMMSNVIIGFIILLSAWLIVDTIMATFVDRTKLLGPWNEISCVVQPSVPYAGTTSTSTGGTPGPTTGAPRPSGGALSHADAIKELGGITVVSSGNCTDRNNKTCTSLDGMQPGALTEIKAVINGCTGCNLQITAGTEVGHTNSCHVSGTCVDIRCANGCTLDQVTTVSSTAKNNGARVVYETISCSDRDAARARGVTAYCKSDRGYGHITGNHFSLYTE